MSALYWFAKDASLSALSPPTAAAGRIRPIVAALDPSFLPLAQLASDLLAKDANLSALPLPTAFAERA